MPGGVFADNDQHRRVRAAGVVQIAKPVRQSRTEVQQGHRRLFGHAGITVGGPGAYALKQTQNRPYLRRAVQGLHHGHLGGSGVGEAHFDAALGGRLHQELRASHCSLLFERVQIFERLR